MKKNMNRGFTLIELVMVILLLGILAAVAIPNFLDFRTDAKNSTAYGSLGALRSAISIAVAAIALKEDPATGAPKFPTIAEMQANAFNASHPVLSGTRIMDPSAGIPRNPWTVSTASAAEFISIYTCTLAKSLVSSVASDMDKGWCYNATTGEIWANSDLNAGGVGKTENTY